MGTLAVVEMPLKSGLPKDKIVNTFAIAEAGFLSSRATDYITAVSRVYTANEPTDGGTLGRRLSPAISRATNACAVKLYNITGHLDGSPHGSPYAVGTFTMPAALDAAGLPEEVALVVTLEAANRADQFVERPDGSDPGSAVDRPRQRYTGRVYLGPWGFQQQEADANSLSRPSGQILPLARAVLVRLAQEIDAIAPADECSLGVWSRADQAIRGVTDIRTDNAWDTQRRRGVAPTAVTRVSAGVGVPEIELAS